MRFLGRSLTTPLSWLPCRACLRPLDAGAEAGICGPCWSGLRSLPEERCPICALCHDLDSACPDPCVWTRGDALWDYHGGRPALGALLIPAIKEGELGWKRALLSRASTAPFPDGCQEVDLVTAVPGSLHRRLLRGFDLAEDLGRQVARQLDLPFQTPLRRRWSLGRQALRTETERRRLPRRAMQIRKGQPLQGRTVLLVDDVWTTGTTLLRCGQALLDAGAREIRVFTLFRAL